MLLAQVPNDPGFSNLSSDSESERSDSSEGEIEEELETLKPVQVCCFCEISMNLCCPGMPVRLTNLRIL